MNSLYPLDFQDVAVVEAVAAQQPSFASSEVTCRESQQLVDYLGQLRPFLSTAVWQRFNEGQLSDSTQPFEATIFFVDLVNSSTLLVRYPLDSVVHLLNRFFTLVEEIVHQHHGFTEKLMGDGLLGIFPNATVALQAAQATQMALADLNAWHMVNGECPLLARTTLDSGEVIITSLGGRWRMDHTVVGVPVNAASDLLRFAQPGEVWFTQAIREHLGDVPLATEASYVRLKGYSVPQTIYRLPVEPGSRSRELSG